MTQMFLSDFYSLISSACLYNANLYGWDALGMWCVEEATLASVFGSLSDFFADSFRVENPTPTLPIVIDRDEIGKLAIVWLIRLQKWGKDSYNIAQVIKQLAFIW